MSPIVQIPGTEGVGTIGVNGPRVPLTKDQVMKFSEMITPDSNPELQENSVEHSLQRYFSTAERAVAPAEELAYLYSCVHRPGQPEPSWVSVS